MDDNFMTFMENRKNGVLLIDFEKSGSLLLFNVIRLMQEENDAYMPYKRRVGLESVINFFCADYLHHPHLSQVDLLLHEEKTGFRLSFPHPDFPHIPVDIKYLDQTSSLIHTHLDPALINEKTQLFETRKVIYIYRDIRDVINSWLHYAVQPTMVRRNPQYTAGSIEELLKKRDVIADKMAKWSHHIKNIKFIQPEPFVIRFEHFIPNKMQVVHSLAQYLKLPCNIDRIMGETNFQMMKKNAPEHLRSGGKGEWRDVFDAELIALCKKHCGEILVELGYEKDQNW
jgi:hypothetical protein